MPWSFMTTKQIQILEGVNVNLPLKLSKSRSFKNGNVLVCYEPVGSTASGLLGPRTGHGQD
jgi:hypothetical protein